MKNIAPIADSLNKVIHEKARLGIMSLLSIDGEADFKKIKKILSLSDGNINAHIKVLEKNGFISIHKEFKDKKPRTVYKISDSGRNAFNDYINALEIFIKNIKKK